MSEGTKGRGAPRRAAAALCAAVALIAITASGAAAAKPDEGPVSADPLVTAPAPPVDGPKLLVSGVANPPADAKAGSAFTLAGTVTNDGKGQGIGPVTVELTRGGETPHVIGKTTVSVDAGDTASYSTGVKIPTGLADGSYLLVACVLNGGTYDGSSCATATRTVTIGDADPAFGPKIASALASARAKARRADPTCTSGARTLSNPGDVIYPEEGNGGYKSVHTDLHFKYDAPSNLFVGDNNVQLTDLATQCLSDFSLDFEATSTDTTNGPNLTIGSITVNGTPATWAFKQPTYPGDPNGPDDPDPNAHTKGLANPVNGTVNLPPACGPNSSSSSQIGAQCPATKLVITPATPIASGATFVVQVNYTGRPGIHTDADGSTEGWFRNNNPVGDGSFVTTEPIGNMAWMPLNNHPKAKPTYDSYTTTNPGRTVAANGELSGFTDNAADADFPGGSRTWHWHQPAPIANYLVTNSVGAFDSNQFVGTNGLVFNQFQGSSITSTKKTSNLAVMNTQNTLVDFQSTTNGPWPFTTDGVVVGIPSASFEEEMQTMITFNGGSISQSTFAHENMHQWFGDNVSEDGFNLTALKEGFATLGEYYWTARTAAINAGGLDTTAGKAAWETSLNNRFNSNYASTSTSMWGSRPFWPTSAGLFSTGNIYTRPGTAYLSMRAILGQDSMTKAMAAIEHDYAGGTITRNQLVAEFQQQMPNQSATCLARVDTWATQWFDTAYASGGGANRPQLTGPGLANNTAGGSFYDTAGGGGSCQQAVPTTTPSYSGTPSGGKYTDPTVTLSATDTSGPGVASTTYTVDGGAAQTYTVPFKVTGDGTHTLTFSSTDTAGNVEKTKTASVLVGTPPVTTATVNPVLVNGAASTQATVTLSATDESSGVASTEYQLDGSAWTTYTAPFTVTAGGQHTVLYRSTDNNGNVEDTKTLTFVIYPTGQVSVGGTVPSTLGLTVTSPAPSLGSFTPGVAQDYTTSVAANVTSSAASSTLSVQDPSTTAPGKLVNGAFALASPLQVKATDATTPTSAFAPLAGNAPLALLSYGSPVSNDPVMIGFKQSIAANEPLRTGSYGKTVLFTLSTTSP